MSYLYTQGDEFTQVVSPLTHNTVIVNQSEDRFLVPGNVDLARVRAVGASQEPRWKAMVWSRQPRGKLRESLPAFASVETVDQYRSALETLIIDTRDVDAEAKEKQSLRGSKARALDLLLRLWSEDLLAWPIKMPFDSKTLLNYEEFTIQHHLSWFNEIKQASASKSDVVRNRCATMVLRSSTTAIGIREAGDLTEDVVTIKKWAGLEKGYFSAIKCVMRVQQNRYGKAAVFPSARWTKHLGNEKFANPFEWATDKGPQLAEWASLCHRWVEIATGNLVTKRTAGTHLLRHLAEFEDEVPTPLQYCRRDYRAPVAFREWIDAKADLGSAEHRARMMNTTADMFDWLLSEKLTLTDDYGHPVVSPEHCNPITRVAKTANPAQTHREAMPVRYINELVSILTENDMAWPKQQLTDYFSFYNKVEQRWERIWSPVRVILLLVKLHLPLRTFQVRVLDSGERDPEIYRKGQWIPNDGPFAPRQSASASRKGFLRRFDDTKVLRTFTGFYINTNKTADRLKDAEDRGYEIPWQHQQVIDWIEYLRDWQMRYNPVDTPISWGDVNEQELRARHSKSKLADRGEVMFLFRDPCAPDPRYPIRGSRLSAFWNGLMDELERRVAARGEVLPNGDKIAFVKTRQSTGRAGSPVYDLHTLRVSLLTAYATDGGVPIEILSKCVAGHASLLMTLYYIKTGPAYITEQLAIAQERIAEKEKESFVRFMLDAKLGEINESAAFLDGAGPDAIMASSPGSWVVNDKGICPVGGSRCSVGGPKVTSAKERVSDYAPVPGGPKNCVRCRFFITGPAFLGGLVAHFNVQGYHLMEVSKKFRDQSDAIQQIENEMLAAERSGSLNFDSKKLDLAYERRDQLMKQVDDLAANWHDAYKLIERCKAIMASKNDPGALNLVLSGSQADLEVAIEMTTDFDLINAVCQVANVYPAEDATMASLRRARLLDAMLAKNACRPIFAELTDDEALRVGNEFVTFLQARVGRAGAAELLEGRRVLNSAGMVNEIATHLEKLSSRPVLLSDVHQPVQGGTVRLLPVGSDA